MQSGDGGRGTGKPQGEGRRLNQTCYTQLPRSLRLVGAVRGLFRLLRFMRTFLAAAIVSLGARVLLPRAAWERMSPALRRVQGRQVARACGVRMKRIGAPDTSAGLLISNHLSWLDSFVLMGECGARFVASSTFAGIPVISPMLRAAGVVFVNKTRLADTRRVGGAVQRIIARGQQTFVFPEADTSRGAAVRPFRAALLEPIVHAGAAVHWMSLRYQTPPGWPPASVVVSWADWTPLLLHMYRAFYPPYLLAEVRHGDQAVYGTDRKALALALHNAVSRAFIPLPQLPAPDLARISVPPPRPQPRF